MSSLLVGSGVRLFRLDGRPYIEPAAGQMPIDLAGMPDSVVNEYSKPGAEYGGNLWIRLAHAGVERVRWTHGPLNHLLGGNWVSEEAFETLCGLVDNVFSPLSFVFDDGVTQRRYYQWLERGWPVGLDRAADGSRVYPWLIHDECIPPVPKWDDNPTQTISRGEEMTVAVASFIDRDRLLNLRSKLVVTERFVNGWRESAVGREIAEAGEPDLEFSEWSLGRSTPYRWVDVAEPEGLSMTPEIWYPPGSLASEPKPD